MGESIKEGNATGIEWGHPRLNAGPARFLEELRRNPTRWGRIRYSTVRSVYSVASRWRYRFPDFDFRAAVEKGVPYVYGKYKGR